MSVSVIVPVFNGKEFIDRSVSSILPELGQDDELILVDDGSTDGTFGMLCGRFSTDKRILLAARSENNGPAAARNTGIRLSRGEWIAFCDADDEWLPGKLSAQLRYAAEYPEVQIVLTGEETVCDDESARTGKLQEYARNDTVHFRNALIRHDVFERIGLMDESMRIREDTEWLVRARTAGVRMGSVPDPLYRRHLRDGGLSANASEEGRKERMLSAFARGIREKKPETADAELLSILVPVYNADKYVGEAVSSCKALHRKCELVLINDGSSDGSLSVLRRLLSDRLYPDGLSVTLVHRKHKGQASSRNDAFRLSRGKYLLYLDADDYFTPGAIDLMADTADKSPEAFVISAMCRDFLSPDLTEEESSKLKINPDPYRRMLAGCMLMRRSVFEQIGTYDETMATSETAQWVMRIRDAGLSIREIGEVTLMRRYHNGNLGRVNREAQMNSYMEMIRLRLKNRKG